jgi:hypothetical protein
MEFFTSKFHVTRQLAEGRLTLVDLRNDGSDSGLYASRFSNSFGTPLMCRGTREECIELLVSHRRSEIVEVS